MKKTDIKKRSHPPTFFSDEFKLKIITEYLETDLTKREILDLSHGSCPHETLYFWFMMTQANASLLQ
ncbi:MAG: hypothetical protein R2852_10050 [Bacteroidia bacterium]